MFKSHPRDVLPSLRHFLNFLLSIPREIPKSQLKLRKNHFHVFLNSLFTAILLFEGVCSESNIFAVTLYGLAATSVVTVSTVAIFGLNQNLRCSPSVSSRSIIMLSSHLSLGHISGLSFRFPRQNAVRIGILLHSCYIPRPCYPSLHVMAAVIFGE